MKWLCLSALWVLSLAACGRPVHEYPADRAMASLNCSTGVTQPWSCLEQACSSAGGRIDGASHECICSGGQVFMGWNAPHCESRQADSHSSILNTSARNREGATSQVKITLPENTDTMTSLSVANMSATHNFPLFTQDRVQIYVPALSPIRPTLLERYLFAPPPPVKFAEAVFGQGMMLRYPERIYYSTLEELYSILQSTDYPDPNRDQLQEPSRYGQLINAALAAKEFSEIVISLVDLGCLGACEVHRKYTVAQFPAYNFEQTTFWSGGVPYRSYLNISQGGEFPVATIFQSAHGRPLMYAEYEENSSNGQFSRIAKFTNTLGEKMGEHSFDIDAQETTAQRSASTADVLMCEAWYGENWNRPELQKHLVRGPLAANTPTIGASLWGWHASKSEEEFFSGFKPTSPMGFFDYSDYSDPMEPTNYVHHFEEVLEQIIGQDDSGLTVAPMTPTECEHHAILRSGIQNPPRVINYSTVDYRSPRACAAAFPELASTPFLWVLGAGNDGFSDQTRSQTLCPHNAIPSKKEIVVGAVDFDGNVESYSNQNRSFVDIYAPGKSCFQGEECNGTPGTSFAAPRVAHVAAKIAKLYPQLTNGQIRMAILLGADESYNLPALSGGLLREKESIAFAKSILDTGSYEEAVKANYPAYWLRARPKKLKILADILARDSAVNSTIAAKPAPRS